MANQQAYHPQMVKIIEESQVSPPPGFVPSPSSSIPLAFFDLPWVHSVPVQSIFFYDFPHSTDHFLQKVLPNLKHSLSLTLQHFFPLASNLAFPPQPQIPHILYSEGDSIPFTVAESTQNLHHLTSNTIRDVRDLHPFVPTLPPSFTTQDGTKLFPLAAIQVTVLPNSGFSISVTFRHVVADGKAFLQFMKFWANVCMTLKKKKDLAFPTPFPLLNRDTVEDPKGFRHIFLQDLWDSSPKGVEFNDPVPNVLTDKVRVSFVLSHEDVQKLKKWVHAQSKSNGSLHVSTFVVTCSLTWVCLAKSEEAKNEAANDEIYELNFVGDCRGRQELSIPTNYFANCLVWRTVSLEISKLVGENGIAKAAIAIGSKIIELQRGDPLNGVENSLKINRELSKRKKQYATRIGGSPKLGTYDTDFGWGKPEKTEILHIEYSGAIALSDCKDNEGGVEVGLVLGRAQANRFIIALEECLENIVCVI